MRRTLPVRIVCLLTLESLVGVFVLAAQTGNQTEITSHESEPTFKLQVERKIVLVRAVVRDAQGRALGNLVKEDFRLFDNGKPQVISGFAVETPAIAAPSGVSHTQEQLSRQAGIVDNGPAAPPAPPSARYLGLYFDDVHTSFEDLVHARTAAQHYLASALHPGDFTGVFTASGVNSLDFTDNQARLNAAISRLLPQPMVTTQVNSCPQITEYQAYLIAEQHDPAASGVASDEYFGCNCSKLPSNAWAECRAQGDREVLTESRQLLILGETRSEQALRELAQLVRRLSTVNGQRNIIMISPGFLEFTLKARLDQVIDQAVRTNIIINALDAKGLFNPLPLGDASDGQQAPGLASRAPDAPPRGAPASAGTPITSELLTEVNLAGSAGRMAALKSQFRTDSVQRAADVMRDLSVATGGVFFENSNDYDEGFRKAGGFPEVYYVLSFSPQSLKTDGKFHALKVELAGVRGVTVEARRGYYAPSSAEDAATRARQDLVDAVFSKEELTALPLELSTQFFKPNASEAQLTVSAHVDLRTLRFHRQDQLNLNELTLVTALFDQSGKYVKGKQKVLDLRLRDTSLEKLSRLGLTSKTGFDVTPGAYLVREVVTDSVGGLIAATTRTVEIPF